MFRKFFSLFSKNLAMDLGTANTLLYTPKEGIVINEPSVVAIDTRSNSIIAVGREAKDFLGRTPECIKAIRPMRDGVIADFEVTKEMIAFFVRKAIQGRYLSKPRIVICVPTGITQVEKRAVIESAHQAGVREVLLIEEPMAAAIGFGLPINDPVASMVVDIGGGTTEVAIISLSTVAYSESVRIAGDEMNEAIQRHIQSKYQLLIGENISEEIKIAIGSLVPNDEPMTMEVSGKHLVTGTPTTVTVTEEDIREAMSDPIRAILDAVRRALEKIPPTMAADIANSGMLLAGGGALIRGLDQLLADEAQVKVVVDPDPLTTIVRGTGKTIEDRQAFRSVFVN